MTASGGDSRAFLEACINAGILADHQQIQVIFGWPSLLEYLDLGPLFEKFLKFDDQNKLFAFITSTLALDSDKDLLITLYDRVFVECLTHVKALPQIHSTFLINQIQKKRHSPSFSHVNHLFSLSLDRYEKSLVENPSHAMHDLILYLAWDRVCINLAIVFEHVSPNQNVRNGLEVLKECLIESFQHITSHGRTAPGFFRLIESLYAYQMREENLQAYTDSEWLTLCQSSFALKSRDGLIDVFYIDAAVVDDQEFKSSGQEGDLLRVFTFDSLDNVKACLSLAHYMIEKLKAEGSGWRYILRPVEIVCLKEYESGLSIDTIVCH